jgi:DNA polymerase-3 subunit gamma/tau
MAEAGEQGTTGAYRVLARKYRPTTFAELYGQDAMVRTLSNAIKSGRLAHAFILTGVRGVGKTTTARLIARALNCIGPDGKGGPTIEPCGVCTHCVAIAESRHVDVMEMDAASRTGVDDIREIIDGVRYAPVSAREKIYIIDEVHMLSKNAFNALLKTLEEPPEHVRFIFATTEIRKVPVTVLSRCQRFDLRRVEIPVLIENLRMIAEKEKVTIDDGAYALIARAAEGSVRDAQSLLEQALAHGAGEVTEERVRDMLGLADRVRMFDLYEAVMAGKIADALEIMREQYRLGADPTVILEDLLDLTHWLTRLKLAPDASDNLAIAETERTKGRDFAAKLSMPVLTRSWQILLKGLDETRRAPSPDAAAEMALVRLAFSAELPDPADLVKRLDEARDSGDGAPSYRDTPAPRPREPVGRSGGPVAASSRPAPSPRPAPSEQTIAAPTSFAELVALFAEKREMILHTHLTDHVHVVRFAHGHLEVRIEDKAPANLAAQIGQKLKDWTGERWVVSLTQDLGEPTLHEQQLAHDGRIREEALRDPLVKTVLETFPGAEITAVRKD